MIEREEFKLWLESPITKAIMALVSERAVYYTERILDGAPSSAGVPLIAFGEHIGRVNAYKELLEIEFDEVKEADDDK